MPGLALQEMGSAYVRFALANRAVFRLMFDRDTFTDRTAALTAESSKADETLSRAVLATSLDSTGSDLNDRIEAIWSIVHGFAGLSREGQICQDATKSSDPEEKAARTISAFLRGAHQPGKRGGSGVRIRSRFTART